MTAFERRTFAGNAPDSVLTTTISPTALSITINDATGYPAGPAYLVIDPGKTTEEKVRYQSLAGNTFTIVSTADRGADGTTAQTHSGGSAIVRLCYTAIDADEANNAVTQTIGKIQAKGDLLVGSAANALSRVAKGTTGQIPTWQADGSIAAADAPVKTVAGRGGNVTLTTADVPGALDQRTITKGSLAGYTEQVTTTAAAGSTITYDATAKNVYDTTLTANLAVTFTAGASGSASELTVIHRQDATGSRITTWPASVKWPNGTPPAPNMAANAINIWTFVSVDGGTSWFGFLAGKGMA